MKKIIIRVKCARCGNEFECEKKKIGRRRIYCDACIPLVKIESRKAYYQKRKIALAKGKEDTVLPKVTPYALRLINESSIKRSFRQHEAVLRLRRIKLDKEKEESKITYGRGGTVIETRGRVFGARKIPDWQMAAWVAENER